jgi:hypothetical protein
MTKARDISSLIGSSGQIDNTKITLDANEIPNLDTAKITTGTFADARISNSSVVQHSTPFDDNKIVNDISTLALRQASDANRSAYNTNSQSVDVFQDDTGIDTTTNVQRNASEFVSSVSSTTGTNTTAYRYYRFNYTTDANANYPKVYEIYFHPLAGANGAEFSKSGASLAHIVGGQYGSSNGTNSALDGNSGTVFWMDTTANPVYTVDFGSGTSHVVKSLRFWWQQHATTNNIKIYGSNNNSDFNLLANDNGDGTNNYFDQQELGGGGLSKTFELDDATNSTENATGNFTGTTITAPSSVSSMGAIITYQDNAGTNALNTDIVLQLSADGGSNYSTATLTALPDFSTGIKMAKVNDLAVTAGTQLKYKISFANQALGSKEARIRGVALQY